MYFWHPFACVCLGDALLNYDTSLHFRISPNTIFMGVVPPNRTIHRDISFLVMHFWLTATLIPSTSRCTYQRN